jgi:hypothetical protein
MIEGFKYATTYAPNKLAEQARGTWAVLQASRRSRGCTLINGTRRNAL